MFPTHESGRHSGIALARMRHFPEGPGSLPSVATPNHWTEPDEFERWARHLTMPSEGLSLASENGLMHAGGGVAATMMGA